MFRFQQKAGQPASGNNLCHSIAVCAQSPPWVENATSSNASSAWACSETRPVEGWQPHHRPPQNQAGRLSPAASRAGRNMIASRPARPMVRLPQSAMRHSRGPSSEIFGRSRRCLAPRQREDHSRGPGLGERAGGSRVGREGGPGSRPRGGGWRASAVLKAQAVRGAQQTAWLRLLAAG